MSADVFYGEIDIWILVHKIVTGGTVGKILCSKKIHSELWFPEFYCEANFAAQVIVNRRKITLCHRKFNFHGLYGGNIEGNNLLMACY